MALFGFTEKQMHQIVLTVKWYLLLELHKAGKPYKGWFDPMKGPKADTQT
jgi:hypothetical protein